MRFAICKPLPGKVIAVLDPQNKISDGYFPCPDGHAQGVACLMKYLSEFNHFGGTNFCTKVFYLRLQPKKPSL